MAAHTGSACATAAEAHREADGLRVLRAAQRGDRRARERTVAAHLGLVRAVAARYRDLGVPFDDLLQEGALGLLDAIDRFDPARDVDFERYARFRVRRAIRGALTSQSRLVRLPKYVVERRRAIERAAGALTAATGRAPSPEELADATGLSPAAVHEARAAAADVVSLDEPILPDGSALVSVIADRTSRNPQDELLERERSERLRSGLAALPPRQRRMIERSWGLGGTPAASTKELAAELAVSPGRARTIANDGLYVLREALGQ